MKFRECMVIEYGSYSMEYRCPKCVPEYPKNEEEGMVECFRSILVYHSEERAKLDGWTKIGDRWVCPECSKKLRRQ